MSFDRGAVVIATDPFKDDDATGRPFLLISRSATPFHGEQSIALALTTRTWYDDRIPLHDDDWIDGGAPESSSIMPWSVHTLRDEWIAARQGRLREAVVDQAVTQLVGYLQ